MKSTEFIKLFPMRSFLALILFVLLLQSCKQKADPLTNKTYTAEKVGWTINLPGEKWKVMTEAESKKYRKSGKEMIEDAIAMKVDTSGLQNLISLKKDQLNYFFASLEPYDSVAFTSYDQLITELHDVLKTTYESKKIPAKFEIGATRINGIMLDRLVIKIPPKAPGAKPFFQEVYSCLINNYVLGITLIYNNESDKETLQNILNSSNFTMKSDL